jgi:hypothetical protein
MLPKEGAAGAKKNYVKPQLATHGSVQQLTEGAKDHGHKDCGSSIKLPIGKGGWKFDW